MFAMSVIFVFSFCPAKNRFMQPVVTCIYRQRGKEKRTDIPKRKQKEETTVKRTGYRVLDVARHVVNYINDRSSVGVTNLRLRLLLYFIWVEYYKATETFLFSELFYAWQLGPAIPEVFYEYCYNTANPIRDQEIRNPIDPETAAIIDPVIDALMDKTTFQLSEESQRSARAWWNTYYNRAPKAMIPYEDIIRFDTLLPLFTGVPV